MSHCTSSGPECGCATVLDESHSATLRGCPSGPLTLRDCAGRDGPPFASQLDRWPGQAAPRTLQVDVPPSMPISSRCPRRAPPLLPNHSRIMATLSPPEPATLANSRTSLHEGVLSTSPTAADLNALEDEKKSASDVAPPSPPSQNAEIGAEGEKKEGDGEGDVERNESVDPDNVLAAMSPARKRVLLLCFVSHPPLSGRGGTSLRNVRHTWWHSRSPILPHLSPPPPFSSHSRHAHKLTPVPRHVHRRGPSQRDLPDD